MQVHRGIHVRQTPKILLVRSSFGWAGETKFALKWGGRTDRTAILYWTYPDELTNDPSFRVNQK